MLDRADIDFSDALARGVSPKKAGEDAGRILAGLLPHFR
jgi:hypothetical protein